MACCQYCIQPIPTGGSRFLHASCAAVLRRWVHPMTVTQYRMHVPSLTRERERDLLSKYDAEQLEKEEVPANAGQ